jgi:hypothetical protein
VKVTLNLFTQRRAAADEITNAAAESFVNRIEKNLSEIERSLVE